MEKLVIDIWNWWNIIYQKPNFWNWTIFIISITTLIVALITLRYTRRQGMPSFTLVKNPYPKEQRVPIDDYEYKIVTNNMGLVVRISNYGYITFSGKKVNISQGIDQNTTYVPTDWGQKLIFTNEPPKEDIYYFYIYEIHTQKTYRLYPNGKWFSRIKRFYFILRCK